jgi:hypothetical protein
LLVDIGFIGGIGVFESRKFGGLFGQGSEETRRRRRRWLRKEHNDPITRNS